MNSNSIIAVLILFKFIIKHFSKKLILISNYILVHKVYIYSFNLRLKNVFQVNLNHLKWNQLDWIRSIDFWNKKITICLLIYSLKYYFNKIFNIHRKTMWCQLFFIILKDRLFPVLGFKFASKEPRNKYRELNIKKLIIISKLNQISNH